MVGLAVERGELELALDVLRHLFLVLEDLLGDLGQEGLLLDLLVGLDVLPNDVHPVVVGVRVAVLAGVRRHFRYPEHKLVGCDEVGHGACLAQAPTDLRHVLLRDACVEHLALHVLASRQRLKDAILGPLCEVLLCLGGVILGHHVVLPGTRGDVRLHVLKVRIVRLQLDLVVDRLEHGGLATS